jgi:UDP-N-acetylmuramyl pentapeptide phosphotransferase/UDP-N-acetylglucosamine-1-phosphate transferase
MVADGWLGGATAFVAVAGFVPLLRALARRRNLFDPTGPLKIHSQPIPRVGGLALILAFSTGTFASLGLNSYRAANCSSPRILLPVMLAGFPLLDLGRAVLRRLRKGVSPFSGDRQHFFDLLLTRGIAPRQVALSCFGVAAALEAVGLLRARSTWAVALPVLSVVAGAFLITAICLGSLRAGEFTAITNSRESSVPGTLLSGGA